MIGQQESHKYQGWTHVLKKGNSVLYWENNFAYDVFDE
jgi:hypothetical protein